MQVSLKGRSLLTLSDFSADEIRQLIDTAHAAKRERRAGELKERFRGRNLALLFEKRSTRTRCAFETAFGEEGGNTTCLSTDDIHLGKKESIADTARVLGRMYDAIQFRGFDQASAEALARHSGVPVYNGLTDSFHPTQVLADLMTIEEHRGSLSGTVLAYVGDGRNNVARSLMIGCARMDVHLRVICPVELEPEQGLLTETNAACTSDIQSGLAGADFVYTDVWTSMGEEAEAERREELLAPFQVNRAAMEMTNNPNVRFMHCLPAVKGKEVTEEVMEGPGSVVWDEAENRKHTIKALMLETI